MATSKTSSQKEPYKHAPTGDLQYRVSYYIHHSVVYCINFNLFPRNCLFQPKLNVLVKFEIEKQNRSKEQVLMEHAMRGRFCDLCHHISVLRRFTRNRRMTIDNDHCRETQPLTFIIMMFAALSVAIDDKINNNY